LKLFKKGLGKTKFFQKKAMMFKFADFVILTIFLVLVLLFFFPMVQNYKEVIIYEVDTQVRNLETETALINYLRANTEQEVPFADLISYSFAKDDFAILEEQTIALFDEFYKTDEKVWKIQFELGDSKQSFDSHYRCDKITSLSCKTSSSLVSIPYIKDPTKVIQITLNLANQKYKGKRSDLG